MRGYKVVIKLVVVVVQEVVGDGGRGEYNPRDHDG
jgi:hypothetical protein